MLNEMVLCEELFHTPSGVAFADFITEGHRETWPIRSKRFRTWLRRCYYHATGSAPSAAAIRSALDLLEARAQFDGPSARSIPASPSMPAGSILILPMSIGAPLRLAPTAGEFGCPPVRSVEPRYVAAAGTGARRIDRSPAVLPQSFEPERLCVGRRMAAGRVAIERSLSAARNIRRAGLGEDSSYQSSSGRWSIPMRPQSERSRARNAS